VTVSSHVDESDLDGHAVQLTNCYDLRDPVFCSSIMEGVQDTDVWSNEDSSQVFRQHMEQVVQSCQSGQQSIMDLVRVLKRNLSPILQSHLDA